MTLHDTIMSRDEVPAEVRALVELKAMAAWRKVGKGLTLTYREAEAIAIACVMADRASRPAAPATDAEVERAMQLWFGDAYEGGQLLGCSVEFQTSSEEAFRQILARPAPAPQAVEEVRREAAEDERLHWFMTLMSACGGRGAECSDDLGEWVSVFCSDFEPTDTFNRANSLGLISISHNDLFDSSHCQITKAGKAWIADRQRARAGQDGGLKPMRIVPGHPQDRV